MMLFTPAQRDLAQAISTMAFCNPFTPERVEAERRVLGSAYTPQGKVWSLSVATATGGPHIAALRQRVAELVDALHAKLARPRPPRVTPDDLSLYEDIALYHLYEQHRDALSDACDAAHAGRRSPAPHACWPAFLDEFNRLLQWPGLDLPGHYDPAHVFACFFQIRRAFTHIFHSMVGSSAPAARLRAAAWQSIFTHDLRRYHRGLFTRMGDFTTLITGSSGTGKELVARAIGLSRYVPFDPRKPAFSDDFAQSFFAVNLAALSPTLIESELFGHVRGAFTGAVADRKGWLEVCPPRGTVFLDEIGELDGSIQVKLLRVLQVRTFERLGDTTPRTFSGKIIAATNRDLGVMVQAGRFREDLYYRLCSDVIRTPSLAEQLADRPDDLSGMVRFIVRGLAAPGDDALQLADELTAWIVEHLGEDYAWPGNFRELEQCVRNLIVRGRYTPLGSGGTRGGSEALAAEFEAGSLTADELVTRYVAHVHARTGSYVATARSVGLDRRTVKARVQARGEN